MATTLEQAAADKITPAQIAAFIRDNALTPTQAAAAAKSFGVESKLADAQALLAGTDQTKVNQAAAAYGASVTAATAAQNKDVNAIRGVAPNYSDAQVASFLKNNNVAAGSAAEANARDTFQVDANQIERARGLLSSAMPDATVKAASDAYTTATTGSADKVALDTANKAFMTDKGFYAAQTKDTDAETARLKAIADAETARLKAIADAKEIARLKALADSNTYVPPVTPGGVTGTAGVVGAANNSSDTGQPNPYLLTTSRRARNSGLITGADNFANAYSGGNSSDSTFGNNGTNAGKSTYTPGTFKIADTDTGNVNSGGLIGSVQDQLFTQNAQVGLPVGVKPTIGAMGYNTGGASTKVYNPYGFTAPASAVAGPGQNWYNAKTGQRYSTPTAGYKAPSADWVAA